MLRPDEIIRLLPNISVLWDKSTDMFEMVDTYVQNNQEQTNLTPDDIKKIRQSVTKLSNLPQLSFYRIRIICNHK